MKITGNEPSMPLLINNNAANFWSGLTIRERMAMEFTAAYIRDYSRIESIEKSIDAADELIKALNETPNPNI
jgi:hypothetical protein